MCAYGLRRRMPPSRTPALFLRAARRHSNRKGKTKHAKPQLHRAKALPMSPATAITGRNRSTISAHAKTETRLCKAGRMRHLGESMPRLGGTSLAKWKQSQLIGKSVPRTECVKAETRGIRNRRRRPHGTSAACRHTLTPRAMAVPQPGENAPTRNKKNPASVAGSGTL